MVHPGRRYLSALVVVGLLALVPSCSPHRLQAGEARLSVDRGSRAFASEAGHRLQAVHGEQVLHLGARVRLVSGTARVQLADRSSMELRSVTELRLDRRPVLVAGDVLGISGDGPLTLQAGDATAVVGGVGRLTRTLAVSVTSYRGRTELQSAGRALSIKAPRQATVAALGELPGAAQPIAYDDRDGWDRRYLANAIALGRELAAPVQTFTRSLRTGAGTEPGFYVQLLPELARQPSFGSDLLAAAPPTPGETLVGATIALAGRHGPFADRWAGVFAFRSQGAQWGLVAYDQDVTAADGIVTNLISALDRAPVDFALAAASGPSSSSSAPGPAGEQASAGRPGSTTSPTGAGGSRPGGSTPSTTTTTAPPAAKGPIPPVPSTGTPADPIVEPIVEPLVDTNNGLLPPPPPPPPPPEPPEPGD